MACFTNRDGRQLKKSTKTKDRAQAMQIALELEAVETKARAGSLTTMQLRKVLSDVSEKITGDSLSTPSVEDYLNDWLKGIKARNSAATHERYGNTVRLFLANSNGKAKRPVSSIMPKDVEDFLTWRLNSGAAPKTAIVDLKTLNTAFRRAEAFGTILKNPVAAVRPPKEDSSERDVFTHEEVQKLIAAAPSLDWETLILLGYFVGARLRDCVQMKWEHVFPEQGVIIYHQQKTGKKVVVPMHYHVIEHLQHKLAFGTEGFLCPNLAAKGPGGKHGLSEGFKRIVVTQPNPPMMFVRFKPAKLIVCFIQCFVALKMVPSFGRRGVESGNGLVAYPLVTLRPTPPMNTSICSFPCSPRSQNVNVDAPDKSIPLELVTEIEVPGMIASPKYGTAMLDTKSPFIK